MTANYGMQRGRGPGTGTKRKTATGPPVRPDTPTGNLSHVGDGTWCDTREAAEKLGVTPAGLHALVDAGRLRRHARPGAFPFYGRREILALADELRKEAEG